MCARSVWLKILAAYFSFSALAWAEDAPLQRLYFVASYQGILSLGLAMEIADVVLELPPAGHKSHTEIGQLIVNSAAYAKMETLLPVRLCYLSQFNTGQAATQNAEWWNRIGRKWGHGRLDMQIPQRRVLRRHAEARISHALTTEGDRLAKRFMDAHRNQIPDQDWLTAPFIGKTPPLDRLGLLQWLRGQVLTVGTAWNIEVSDGYKLIGYEIAIEGIETLHEQHDHERPCVRLRLTPRFRDHTEQRPIWLWLTQDAARLPVFIRSRGVLGEFNARLTHSQTAPMECALPAAALELPPLWFSGTAGKNDDLERDHKR